MEDLHKQMFEWTRLDKELKDVNYQASQIRKKKDELQKHLCPVIQDNQLEDNIFSIPSLQTNVSFKEQKNSEAMSYKFLEDKFNDYFNNFEDCQKLLQYIKDNRKKETTYVLKSSEAKEETD